MDLVIKRLSSIEEASAGIIEAAENEKKALEQQMRERIQAFDEEAEKATQEKLDQIRSSLNEEMQKSLADLQKATEDSIQAIENDYNQNCGSQGTKIFTGHFFERREADCECPLYFTTRIEEAFLKNKKERRTNI